MDPMEHVIDVTDETFEQVVVEGSKTAPVVVDLWAAAQGLTKLQTNLFGL